jgi:hypothetical protein
LIRNPLPTLARAESLECLNTKCWLLELE